MGEEAIGFAQGLVAGQRFGLEEVGALAAAPLFGARKSHIRAHVENESNVGFELAQGNALQRADELLVQMPKRALVDPRRVEEAIRDDPGAAGECRLDCILYVIIARSCEK